MSDIFKKFDQQKRMYKQMLEETSASPLGVCIDKVISPVEAEIMGRHCIMLGSNNYLGLTFNEEAIERACESLRQNGTGTTGSRAANGSYGSHQRLEQQIADFFGRKHALLFTTGYQANVGFLSAIAGKNDIILIDADSHASIYDGCRLSSASTLHFRHNSPDDLERRLKRLPEDANKLVITEGIYSMLGDRAPLKEIVEVAKAYNAYVMVDEAHSLGVLGENGRGLAEELGLEDKVDFITGTFSKSVGTIGGFCVANYDELQVLRYAARAYVFTASLPPSIAASASATLEHVRQDSSLREKLWRNTGQLYDGLKQLGYVIGEHKTPVIPIYMPSIQMGLHMWQTLLENGIYVNLAMPPATPKNVCLLRCSVSAAHTEEQIKQMLAVFAKIRPMLDAEQDADASESLLCGMPSIKEAKHQSEDNASGMASL